MTAFCGPLQVDSSTDFTAEITHLAFDSQNLTLVLESKETSPSEPDWVIDCSLPWQGNCYRGAAVLRYDTDADGREVGDPSPATVIARVTRLAAGLSVDLRIVQHDADDQHWTLSGVLREE